jgi:hypothetical protein
VEAGKPPQGISGFGAAEIRGLQIFMNEGKRINCHGGPEFSNAATHLQPENQENGLVERMRMRDDCIALYDNGFYNIGVVPTAFDIGRGGTDPFGNPLSFTEQYRNFLAAHPGFVGVTPQIEPDEFRVDPRTFAVPVGTQVLPNCPDPANGFSTVANDQHPTKDSRTAVNGAFKTPSLRNVELTGPYMHNGSMSTLEQVVEFYNRGGNFVNDEGDPDIGPIGLNAQQKADLVAFLKSLTDARVRSQSAPFDHPSLLLSTGAAGNDQAVQPSSPGSTQAKDDSTVIPQVGKNGSIVFPIKPFDAGLAP